MHSQEAFLKVAKKLQRKRRSARSVAEKRTVSSLQSKNNKVWREWFEKSIVYGVTRVILTPAKGYQPSERFPVQGSQYQCTGTIMEKARVNGYYAVTWDNGNTRIYNHKHLTIVTAPSTNKLPKDPNQAFAMEKYNKFAENITVPILRRIPKDDF